MAASNTAAGAVRMGTAAMALWDRDLRDEASIVSGVDRVVDTRPLPVSQKRHCCMPLATISCAKITIHHCFSSDGKQKG